MMTIYYAQDKRIGRYDVIDALLSVNDGFSQTWIVDSDALFHVTLLKECFTLFVLAHMIQFSLDNNHACSIDGTIHFAFPDAQKLVLHDVRYEPGIKKSLLSVGQLDLHGYCSASSGG